MIASECSNYVDFSSCTFACENEKMKTARVVLWSELNIPCVYTYETSFYGDE